MTLGITAAGLATTAGAVGALGSAGASIYSATRGGGGGGGGIMPQNINQGRHVLGALFGRPKGLNYIKAHPDSFSQYLLPAVQQYQQGTTFGAGGPNVLDSLIGNPYDYLQHYNKSLGFLDQAVNTAAEANQTGLKTDGTALFDEAIRRYTNEALPQAAETAGLGVTSSGFQAASSKAAQDLLGQAALANIDLTEAAANRRLQAAPLLQGVTAAREALPTSLANSLTSLYDYQTRKPIDLFSQFYQLGQGGPYATPAYSPVDTGAANTAALLQGLGGLVGQLGGSGGSKYSNLFGGSAGGTSTAGSYGNVNPFTMNILGQNP